MPDVSVLPKQLDFLRSEAREVIYSGAFGAGKTRALCLRVAMRAATPGSREGLCRRNMVSLKRSTLKTMLEPDGELPPVLPIGTYKYRRQDAEILLHGGGSILMFGTDEPDRLASLNLTGCAVDECVELRERDWTMLRGRIRVKVPGLPNQLYGACNPATPSHWMAKRFGLAGNTPISANFDVIRTSSLDNWFLPEDYIEDLKTMTGVAFARFVEGKWVGSEGLVYDAFDPGKHVVDDVPDSFDRVLIGVDEGYNNPAVLLVIGFKDDVAYVIDEWHERGKLETEMLAVAAKLNALYEPEAFIVDPSAAKLRAAMRAANIHAKPADNTVWAGIQAVASRISTDRLLVSSRCTNTIREFESYEWRESNDGQRLDQPVKKNDHCMDCCRYITVQVDGAKSAPRIREIGERTTENDEGMYDAHYTDEIWNEL